MKLPLTALATPLGEAQRIGDVGVEQIRELLRNGQVRFVIADINAPLNWIPEPVCFSRWKTEIIQHVAEPGQPLSLEQWPGGYVYTATQWNDGGIPIVLLTKHH